MVGPAGTGVSTLVAHLAEAYARAGAFEVVVVAVRPGDGGELLQGRLAPLGVRVEVVEDGRQAQRVAAGSPGALVLVDLPALGLSQAAELHALRADLAELAAGELHLALPATTSSAAADEAATALDASGLTHIALTRMDDTQRAGGGLGYCLSSGRALSYLSARAGAAPASAAAAAQLLIP